MQLTKGKKRILLEALDAPETGLSIDTPGTAVSCKSMQAAGWGTYKPVYLKGSTRSAGGVFVLSPEGRRVALGLRTKARGR
jgi:hypothetical protein